MKRSDTPLAFDTDGFDPSLESVHLSVHGQESGILVVDANCLEMDVFTD